MTERTIAGFCATVAFLVGCVSLVWTTGDAAEDLRRAVVACFFMVMACHFGIRRGRAA